LRSWSLGALGLHLGLDLIDRALVVGGLLVHVGAHPGDLEVLLHLGNGDQVVKVTALDQRRKGCAVAVEVALDRFVGLGVLGERLDRVWALDALVNAPVTQVGQQPAPVGLGARLILRGGRIGNRLGGDPCPLGLSAILLLPLCGSPSGFAAVVGVNSEQ
jgi:hypothetical protein